MTEPNQSKVPKIRFKGFEGEWEVKTLGELGRVATTKRIFMHQTSETGDVPFFKIGSFGRDPKLFISNSLFQTYKTRFPFPQNGDLLFSVIGSIGRVVEYTGEDEYFQDSNIVWLQHNGAVVNSFLKQFYSIVKWSGLEGSTITHLYNRNILETKIDLPSQREQTQIGGYFREVDRLIELEQRKHDKLVTLKKAMLQKMFPKPGTTTPEIRFKGFKGDWHEKKLGDVMEVGSVKRIHQSDWTTSGVRFLRARDIVSAFKNEKPSDVLYISPEKYVAYSLLSGKVELGDLLVTGVGTIGVPYLITNTEPVYFKDGNIIWFKNNGAFDGDFLFYSFVGERIQNYIKESAGTGTVGTYTISSGKSTPLASPQKEEQQKIGHYFRTLDSLISQHALQLQKLKQLKAACLERMFV
ncbi:MAG: restriction endonuclease subunit S [Verrucomicrobiaceae bacterium]|nr:restriction endonuclease subunit S [Verrucomicrobiaceae bacterium]